MSASTLDRLDPSYDLDPTLRRLDRELDPFPRPLDQQPRVDDDGTTPAQHHHRRALSTRLRELAGPRLAVGLGLAVIAVAYLLNIAGWPAYFDDEGTYYSQAWALQHLGSLAPYTYWYDHPPVGWLQLAAFTWLPDLLVQGGSSLVAGRIVVVGYVLVSAALLYMLARRLDMARGWALAAMLVWALNPLSLYWGRQVLLDNVALPWLLGAFVLALNYRHHLGKHMLAGLFFGIAVLTKETTLIFGPALLLAIWQSSFRPTRRFAAVGFAMVTALTGLMYLAYAAIRNELLPGDDHVSVVAAIEFQLSSREGSGFILDPSTSDGGAYGTLTGWLQQDPYVLLAGVAAVVVAVFVRRLRPIAVAVAIAALVALRPDGYLPGMYVVAVLPFCALLIAGLVDVAWKRLHTERQGWTRVVAYGMVAGLVALSVQPLQDWRERYVVAFTDQSTRTHSEALAYVTSEVPRDSVVVVDNTFWNDLVDAGWDTDDAIWFYKIDSDPEITEAVGGDFEGIDYLLWSQESMSDLAPIVKEAYDSSDLVWATGEGDQRMEVRKIVPVAEQEARDAAEASIARQDFALEMRALERFYAAPSPYEGLTNGQVEAILGESAELSEAELADKYDTTSETVTQILEDPR
jgi:4-amino-4-deoxy-L-arabinose transferase-like glycosyltransferase